MGDDAQNRLGTLFATSSLRRLKTAKESVVFFSQFEFLNLMKTGQHLLCGLRLARRGLQGPREEQRSSRAMRSLQSHVCPDTEILGKHTKFLLIFVAEQRLPRSLTQETGVLPAVGSLSRSRRVWKNSPCPREINMGRSTAIRNGSFGHLMNPENLS